MRDGMLSLCVNEKRNVNNTFFFMLIGFDLIKKYVEKSI